MRSAPLFQLVIVPVRSLLTMASSEDSTIAASIERVRLSSPKGTAYDGSPPEAFPFGGSSRRVSSSTKLTMHRPSKATRSVVETGTAVVVPHTARGDRRERAGAPARASGRCTGASREKWPGAGLNRRHRDFQSGHIGEQVTQQGPNGTESQQMPGPCCGLRDGKQLSCSYSVAGRAHLIQIGRAHV